MIWAFTRQLPSSQPLTPWPIDMRTMVENRKEHRCKYWAAHSSVRSFARTAHSFACSGLLASLAPSAALTRSLASSLRSLPRSQESEFLMSQNDLVLSHSASSSSSLGGSLADFVKKQGRKEGREEGSKKRKKEGKQEGMQAVQAGRRRLGRPTTENNKGGTFTVNPRNDGF